MPQELKNWKYEFQLSWLSIWGLCLGIFKVLVASMGVGVHLQLPRSAAWEYFFYHFPHFLFCHLLQAKRSETLKKALNLQQVAASSLLWYCQALFCGNPANELHLIVNLCVCFLASHTPPPEWKCHSSIWSLVWMPLDLHLCVWMQWQPQPPVGELTKL